MDVKIRFSFSKVKKLYSWEQGLYKATQEFLQTGVMSSLYLKDVVDEIHKSGRYMVITKDTAILHAQSYATIKEPFICYLYSQQSVHFFGKHIHHIFVFGAKNPENHQWLLSTLSYFITALREDASLIGEEAMAKWFKQQMQKGD